MMAVADTTFLDPFLVARVHVSIVASLLIMPNVLWAQEPPPAVWNVFKQSHFVLMMEVAEVVISEFTGQTDVVGAKLSAFRRRHSTIVSAMVQNVVLASETQDVLA